MEAHGVTRAERLGDLLRELLRQASIEELFG
jgi:hypothetical protein